MAASTRAEKTSSGRAERLGRSAVTGTYVLKPVSYGRDPERAARIARAVEKVVSGRRD